jgi:hypothetical protein
LPTRDAASLKPATELDFPAAAASSTIRMRLQRKP